MSRSPWRPSPCDEPWVNLWRIEPLAGWHLALLSDPAFLPLHPVLRRALLLGLPERILHTIARRPSLAPQVLVAFAPRSQDALGLIVSRRLNRSGSCWQLQHLRTIPATERRRLGGALLRSAIQRARGARSWIAEGSSLDPDRLALLREQGFQPLRTDQLWRWQPSGAALPGATALPAELKLQPLNGRNAALVWHLEQAACPAQLRQLLDRRVEDLLDQSQGRGWLLLDPSRRQAVAAARWVGDHAGGGHDLALTLQEGWQHLLGNGADLLLRHAAEHLGGHGLWLRCDVRDQARQAWLERLGAERRDERVLMARSVWSRPSQPLLVRSGGPIEAVLEQLQPGRRPLPTPVGRH
ncbi:MAG: hypothetical protein ACKO7Z_02205 [Cyanobacteriota bacterium]